jgi:diamine N-acetyltransferase
MTAIAGTKVTLRRARDTDRARIYEWLIGSDLTANLMGAPMFPDRPIQSFEQFSQSYPRHFYEGTRPYAGRMYVITAQGEEIGCISHGPIDVLNDVVELDIWLAERRVAGHGYGSESLVVLCDWLQVNYGVNRFLARPSRRNVKALRAMRRAGFR